MGVRKEGLGFMWRGAVPAVVVMVVDWRGLNRYRFGFGDGVVERVVVFWGLDFDEARGVGGR